MQVHRYSDRLWAGQPAGVRFPARIRDFPLFHSIQTGSGANTASYPVGIGALSPGVKRSGHEADNSPPSSAEVKNGGAIPSLPHTSSWHSAYSVKHRHNFTFGGMRWQEVWFVWVGAFYVIHIIHVIYTFCFDLPNPSSRTMALGSTQPLTEMSTRNLPWG
jgi:hypothetical protein